MKLLKTVLLTKSIIAAAVAASGISASGLASSAPNVVGSRPGADKVQLVPSRQEYPNVIVSKPNRKQFLLPEVGDEVLIVGQPNNASRRMAGKQPSSGAVVSEPVAVSPPFVPRPLP